MIPTAYPRGIAKTERKLLLVVVFVAGSFPLAGVFPDYPLEASPWSITGSC